MSPSLNTDMNAQSQSSVVSLMSRPLVGWSGL